MSLAYVEVAYSRSLDGMSQCLIRRFIKLNPETEQRRQSNVAAPVCTYLTCAYSNDTDSNVGEFCSSFFGKDEKVQDLVDRLNKLMDTEERLVISIIYSTTQQLTVMGERTERMVGEIGQKFDGMYCRITDLKKNSTLHALIRVRKHLQITRHRCKMGLKYLL